MKPLDGASLLWTSYVVSAIWLLSKFSYQCTISVNYTNEIKELIKNLTFNFIKLVFYPQTFVKSLIKIKI